jgi:hypothetical protein
VRGLSVVGRTVQPLTSPAFRITDANHVPTCFSIVPPWCIANGIVLESYFSHVVFFKYIHQTYARKLHFFRTPGTVYRSLSTDGVHWFGRAEHAPMQNTDTFDMHSLQDPQSLSTCGQPDTVKRWKTCHNLQISQFSNTLQSLRETDPSTRCHSPVEEALTMTVDTGRLTCLIYP